MPRTIAPDELKKWTEMYRSGRSYAQIARQTRHDLRTVRGGIGRVLAEEERTAVRRLALQRGFERHWDLLLGTIRRFATLLGDEEFCFSPRAAFASRRQADFTVYGCRVRAAAGGPAEAELPGSLEWKLIAQHLRGDKARTALVRWQEALAAAVSAELAMAGKVAERLHRVTRLPVSDSQETGRVPRSGVQAVLNHALSQAVSGGRELARLAAGLQPEHGGAGVAFRGNALVLGVAADEVLLRRLASSFRRLSRCREFTRVAETRAALSEKTRQLHEELRLLDMTGYLPGTCDVCSRLRL